MFCSSNARNVCVNLKLNICVYATTTFVCGTYKCRAHKFIDININIEPDGKFVERSVIRINNSTVH